MSQTYRNPAPTVDLIIEVDEKIVLIERGHEPFGWALPGGFVDYGEPVERAAIREAAEETGLDVTLEHLLYVYSDPDRDPRKHTMSSVFIATASGRPTAGDDAASAELFERNELPEPICFDHALILKHYFDFRETSELPDPTAVLASHGDDSEYDDY